MKQVLTIVCKLQPTKEQTSQIEDTLAGFANACNHINNTIDPKLTNSVRIHTLIYNAVRELFGLSANLAIRAIKAVIAIEDLTGIRERTNQQPRNKTERRRSNSWAFYQLRQFLEYKAIQAGVSLVKVNPAYTSQMCHNCHHVDPVKGSSYRSGKNFKCGHCGWTGDADLNGAMNIAIIGVSVSKPRGSGLSCSLSKNVSGLLQDSALLCAVGESPVTERAGLAYR